MKRRNFLKAMLAVPLIAAVPAIAAEVGRGHRRNYVVMGVDLAANFSDQTSVWNNYYKAYSPPRKGITQEQIADLMRSTLKDFKFKKPENLL